ncbi:TetR/AcrR family transcriptional regulator [Massilia endophytica]|uniref:TetR/AcrR family transcriptional regulator n=1 Tax=Massilia endophytica TaxID=2899220 RepID=UPI001E643C56|nr:TetR/AcrR family transcriptional regulator [Massilia endophytica]UGQ45194.1 TetR/AcrR family transcriptional regulator [Massilia endophytica]
MNKAPTTRDRLVHAMIHTLQHKGLHGAGLSEILAQAQAPKGVMYHHFPGGKNELAVAAIESTVSYLCYKMDQYVEREQGDAAAALRLWITRAMEGLYSSRFEQGCPLAAVALESTAADVELRQALAAGFAALRARVAAALLQIGHAPRRAEGLAALIISAYEGALLQSRVAQDTAPMEQTTETLLSLIRKE